MGLIERRKQERLPMMVLSPVRKETSIRFISKQTIQEDQLAIVRLLMVDESCASI